jgi:hypothetical protein
MLKIGMDRARHPDLRAEAIYCISQTILDDQNSADRKFKREFAKNLASIISNKSDDLGVRLSALNALPHQFLYKASHAILSFAKGQDPILADAALTKLSVFRNYKSSELFIDLFGSKDNPRKRDIARSYLIRNPTLSFITNLLENSRTHDSKIRAEVAQSLACLKSI